MRPSAACCLSIPYWSSLSSWLSSSTRAPRPGPGLSSPSSACSSWWTSPPTSRSATRENPPSLLTELIIYDSPQMISIGYWYYFNIFRFSFCVYLIIRLRFTGPHVKIFFMTHPVQKCNRFTTQQTLNVLRFFFLSFQFYYWPTLRRIKRTKNTAGVSPVTSSSEAGWYEAITSSCFSWRLSFALQELANSLSWFRFYVLDSSVT